MWAYVSNDSWTRLSVDGTREYLYRIILVLCLLYTLLLFAPKRCPPSTLFETLFSTLRSPNRPLSHASTYLLLVPQPQPPPPRQARSAEEQLISPSCSTTTLLILLFLPPLPPPDSPARSPTCYNPWILSPTGWVWSNPFNALLLLPPAHLLSNLLFPLLSV
jgi:hypothetical protein